ncbi:uncharacterized protein LOC142235351 [Haematobia irritans]|uniref:uncharacterized protein LOC142235351 n=1 Tax=Haematobia irritans TaxID=7368 RepID=UPI003F4FD268
MEKRPYKFHICRKFRCSRLLTMQGIRLIFGLGLGLLKLQCFLSYGWRLENIVQQINQEHKTEINIFLNLLKGEPDGNKFTEEFNEISMAANHLPKVIATTTSEVRQLKGRFSEHSLTVAFTTWTGINATFTCLDKMLHQLQFSAIVIVYSCEENWEEELMYIFDLCWTYGFTTVMVRMDQQLFTYHPYPLVQMVAIDNISHFGDETHLENFQQFKWLQLSVEFPPRFYSYTNRYGQKVYSGYMYKLIDLFMRHHNGSLEHFFFDMWAPGLTADMALPRCLIEKCSLSPVLYNIHPALLPSYSPFLAKVMMIVPTAKEIDESLYLIIPFDMGVWLILLLTGLSFFLLINIIVYRRNSQYDLGLGFLDAFKIILFLSASTTTTRSFKNFILNFLFLFTGIFLTNYYVSCLWSLYTSKVYDPELEQLTDIERTDKQIFVYGPDFEVYTQLESLPGIVHQRFYVGDESLFRIYRKNLNMTYMYTALEDLVDYLLLQQTYLKRSFAKKLREHLYYQPFFVSMIQHSPLFKQFNRYLSRIFENGIFSKFMTDSHWEAIVNGELKFLKDDADEYVALNMVYFQYAFVILCCGWAASLLVYILETYCKR